MDTYSALADPTRRQIIDLLVERGQLSASQVYAQFAVSAPAISQHLQVLRAANLVTMEKRGQQRLYAFNPAALGDLETWLQRLARRVNERFDALDAVLAAEQQKLKDGPP